MQIPDYDVHDEVRIDPARTVLMVIDMQNDFVKEDGALRVPDAEATIPAIQGLRALADEHHVRVVYSQDSHDDGDPEWQIWGEHARVGTWGWEIVDELQPDPRDTVIRKFATTRSTAHTSTISCGSGTSTR